MKTTVTRSALTCDGCDYLMSESPGRMVTLVVRGETFHFHDDDEVNRHDCFRYWAHNPRIMKRSLTNRQWTDEEIDHFMSTMLYRSSSYGPGIPREEKP